jgi:putative nucleotidyltransferase with HDIG domain
LQVFDFISANKLKKLFQQYSEAFNVTVHLLDENKQLLLKFPDDAPQAELIIRPLNLRDSLLGYVAMQLTDKASETYLDFIEKNLSEMIEMSYEMESLSGEVARVYEEISLLWRLSSKLGADLNVDKICNILADEVMNICPSKNISIMLVSETSSGTLEISSIKQSQDLESELPVKKSVLLPNVSLGVDASAASKMTLSIDRGLIGYVFSKNEAVTVCDVHSDERFETLPYPVKSILIVPLIAENVTIGAIIASDKCNGEEFYSTEIKLISSIASECAISIKKALLFDEINNMLFGTVEAFSFAIDAKDSYTYGHSKRVSEIAGKIAKNMGLPLDTVNLIKLAALFHDIGKIGTPEDILLKVEKLNADEMVKIKEHPVVGARMIEHIQKLKEIALWIRHHHEKYDGSGYPTGIVGNEIPLPSRIISMADAFDAITSDRPYRKAFTREEAMRIVKESIGGQFDPFLLEHFEKAVS